MKLAIAAASVSLALLILAAPVPQVDPSHFRIGVVEPTVHRGPNTLDGPFAPHYRIGTVIPSERVPSLSRRRVAAGLGRTASDPGPGAGGRNNGAQSGGAAQPAHNNDNHQPPPAPPQSRPGSPSPDNAAQSASAAAADKEKVEASRHKQNMAIGAANVGVAGIAFLGINPAYNEKNYEVAQQNLAINSQNLALNQQQASSSSTSSAAAKPTARSLKHAYLDLYG